MDISLARKQIIAVLLEESQKLDFPYDSGSLLIRVGIKYDPFDMLTSRSLEAVITKELNKQNQETVLKIAAKILEEFPNALSCSFLRAAIHGNKITLLTRNNIIDELLLSVNSYYYIGGNLEFVDFLNRIWNLQEMPSTDSRFKNASGDIWQHMINNEDWGDGSYLFRDYLALTSDSDERFKTFCEQLVYPLVRQGEEQLRIVELLNKHLARDGFKLSVVEEISGYPIYKVVQISDDKPTHNVKNLIFASIGNKPEIVISDALQNDIQIVKNAEYCLVYDLPILDAGLTVQHLSDWWDNLHKGNPPEMLYTRLLRALGSSAEKLVFEEYYKFIKPVGKDRLPALIPQVYLHYDPYTLRQIAGEKRLPRQRMDFLLLFSKFDRVVIEVDGKQHYSNEDGTANAKKYSEMASADRELQLNGYKVYRFGGYELLGKEGSRTVSQFFEKLLNKYHILRV